MVSGMRITKPATRSLVSAFDTTQPLFVGGAALRCYALVLPDGHVLRDLGCTEVVAIGDELLGPGELRFAANLVLVRSGDGVIRRAKDRYSSRNGDVLTESQADWRVVEHVNAIAYGVLPTRDLE
jgi:hypothetical protein